jgi:hypothetical protein
LQFDIFVQFIRENGKELQFFGHLSAKIFREILNLPKTYKREEMRLKRTTELCNKKRNEKEERNEHDKK